MITINEIKKEAMKIRKLIEQCDKKNTSLVIDDFPIMSCKLSSLLLSYHFLILYPELEIKGISASTGKHSEITHYWLEINDIVIDITGDQYNLIDNKELNNRIIKKIPFPAIHVSHKNESYLYDLFKIKEKEIDFFVYGFPTVSDSLRENMQLGYNQLTIKKTSNTYIKDSN